MNYAGHEKLRAEVAEVASAMCDLRTTMNEMEQRYSFNADTLEHLGASDAVSRKPPLDGSIYRNSGTGFLLQRLRERVCTDMRNTLPGAGSKVSGRHAADAGCLVPGRDSGTG